jgi:hypothetical protein
VKVRFVGGPLAGRELVTTPVPWSGSWFRSSLGAAFVDGFRSQSVISRLMDVDDK